MGIFDVFNKAKAVFDKADFAKEELQKAEQLAQMKRFREAVQITDDILSSWSGDPSFGEQIARQVALGDFLKQVQERSQQWRTPINEANQLAARATAILKQDNGNPLETQALSEALALFLQSVSLVADKASIQAAHQCQQEISQRHKFQSLVTLAREKAQKLFFKQALQTYNEAKQLYSTQILQGELATCSAHIHQEEAYEATFKQAKQVFTQGRIRVAIALLETALAHFPRLDGIELRKHFQKTLQGKELFRAGLRAEQAENFSLAVDHYAAAAKLLADPTECHRRLAIVEVKTQNPTAALTQLAKMKDPQAAYVRGFAYAQQGNWQQAYHEWQSVTDPEVEKQRELLKILAQRDRLGVIKEIEELVEAEKLTEAKTVSLNFIHKFSSSPVVQTNLNEHIQPRLEHAVWKDRNWEKIAETAEQVWLEKQDITALHNWAIASYYRAQSDPSKLEEAIPAWSTALVNIERDPALQDIPWMGSTLKLDEVTADLKQLLEQAIDTVKDRDLEEYFRLRDRYRLEIVALRLIGTPPHRGMKLNELFLAPSCYQRHQVKLPEVRLINTNRQPVLETKILSALYTNWGLAMAACLEGDTARSLQIKPVTQPATAVEQFAESFVRYQEGCYYLQQHQWREAVNPLNYARTEIKTFSDWSAEVDRLCQRQRQAISHSQEHISFAQFWYDLLGSQAAKSYLAEYKAEQLWEKLAAEKITPEKALGELKELQQLDPQNPVVVDLINQVEVNQELAEIERLFKERDFEEMVKKAKRSRHERIRHIVAGFFIQSLMDGISEGELNDPDIIRQVGQWAYELCPDEPAFQEVYRGLRLVY